MWNNKKGKVTLDKIIDTYNKICSHFGFNRSKKQDLSLQSVNIIFNIHSKPPVVIIVGAKDNQFKFKQIPLNSGFTRIQKFPGKTLGQINTLDIN